MRKPPSTVIKDSFKQHDGSASSEIITDLARACLLSVSEVNMWWEHLKTVADNRKRGAAKAAETRRKRKQSQQSSKKNTILCTICQEPNIEFTDRVELWIQCDFCEGWCHFTCAGLQQGEELEDKEYKCELCSH